ncbi:MAG TPA: hypothetical protein VMB50_05405 [Myxococcales bacterium]|nr:hypothetical protein [Myxococcales bacterium]
MPTLLMAALLLGSSGQSAQLQKAKQLFEQGRTDYQAGRFRKAIEEFLAADKLKASPALVYNVAQAYGKLGDLSHAVEYYEDYLVRSPDASDRDAVKATIRNLQAKLQAEPAAPVVVLANPTPAPGPVAAAPAATPPPAAPAETAPPAPGAPEAAVSEPAKPHHSHAVAITLGAIGVAAGIVAIIGIVEVAGYQSTVGSINNGTFKGSFSSATSQAATANTWGDLSIALGVVAVGGLTAAGLTW